MFRVLSMASFILLLITARLLAEVEIKQDEFYVEGGVAYSVTTNAPFTGVVVYYYEKAGVQSKRRYLEGFLTGLSESWYLNRQVEEHVSYDRNKLHGSFKKWHRNGSTYAVGQYEAGHKVGLWQVYDEAGSLVNQYKYVPPPPPGATFTIRPPVPPG